MDEAKVRVIVQTQPLSLDRLKQDKVTHDHILISDRHGKEIVAYVPCPRTDGQASQGDRSTQAECPRCAMVRHAGKVLNQMLRSNRKVAVVVNEHGESIGVLTSEDLIEATFDLEQSRSSRGLARPAVVEMGDLQWEVTGSTSLAEDRAGYRTEAAGRKVCDHCRCDPRES